MESDFYRLELVSFDDIAKDIRRFRFRPNEKFDRNPGNYAQFFISKNPKVSGLSRPFTMASKPGDEQIEFIIKKVGVFTTELFNLKQGDKVDIEAPLGNMYYDKESIKDKPIIFIAGGTGITPFLCIKRHIETNGLSNDLRLIYSVTEEDQIINREEIEEVEVKILVSSKDGRIDEDFLKDNISSDELENSVIFVCGPPKMEKGLDETLKGIGAKDVRRETA